MKAIRRVTGAACAAGTLLLTGVVSAGPAHAAVLSCGSTVTQSTTLSANVGPCSATDGLVVTASNITLNLNGYKVIGRTHVGDQAGIRLVNVSGVTVRNGTVQGFDAGVAILGGSGNTITGVTAKSNVNDLKDGDCDLGDGITMNDSDNNTISGNNAVNNGPFSGISMVGDSNGNVVKNNTVVGNNIGGANGCGNGGNGNEDEGIRVEGPGANNNIVNANKVSQNALSGIGVHSNVGCRNNPPSPGDEPPNDFNTITNNTVSGTAGGGESDGIKVLATGPFGTVVCAASHLTITGNNSSNNERNGIEIPATSTDNTVNTNNVNANGRDGIHLGGPIFENEFTNNGGEVLDLITPDQPTFTRGTDFAALEGSGSGNVTGRLVPIGPINIPPGQFDTAASGCSPADFTAAGFQPGDIALIQRGFCDRTQKVQNAVAAGASAVVFFNEGTTGRTGLIVAGVAPTTIPVMDATFATGQTLYNLTQAGPVTIHVVTSTSNVQTEVNVGAENNTLNRNKGFDNAEHDGHDDNPHCDNNHWTANRFGTVNRSCVRAGGGTGQVKP
jgi:parallel beta-helix repeat protein